jgi:hypothetical protein
MDDVRAHRRECEVVGSVESAAVGKIAQAMRGHEGGYYLIFCLDQQSVGDGTGRSRIVPKARGCWGAIPNKTTNSYVIEISMLN